MTQIDVFSDPHLWRLSKISSLLLCICLWKTIFWKVPQSLSKLLCCTLGNAQCITFGSSVPSVTDTQAPKGCDKALDPFWQSLSTYGIKTGCRLKRYHKWVRHNAQFRIPVKWAQLFWRHPHQPPSAQDQCFSELPQLYLPTARTSQDLELEWFSLACLAKTRSQSFAPWWVLKDQKFLIEWWRCPWIERNCSTGCGQKQSVDVICTFVLANSFTKWDSSAINPPFFFNVFIEYYLLNFVLQQIWSSGTEVLHHQWPSSQMRLVLVKGWSGRGDDSV